MRISRVKHKIENCLRHKALNRIDFLASGRQGICGVNFQNEKSARHLRMCSLRCTVAPVEYEKSESLRMVACRRHLRHRSSEGKRGRSREPKPRRARITETINTKPKSESPSTRVNKPRVPYYQPHIIFPALTQDNFE